MVFPTSFYQRPANHVSFPFCEIYFTLSPDVFQSSILQELVVEIHRRVRMIHLSCEWRKERVGKVWLLAVFLNQADYYLLLTFVKLY